MGKSGMGIIFGPDGKSHMAVRAGGMTFVDGQTYTHVGNVAFGSDGKTYTQLGNAILGSDGKTHLRFGDNPTFIV